MICFIQTKYFVERVRRMHMRIRWYVRSRNHGKKSMGAEAIALWYSSLML